MAQGLDSDTAIQTIIGSDVQTQEVSIEEVGDRPGRGDRQCLPPIPKEVRRRFNLGDVGIVTVLADDTASANAVAESMEAKQLEINDLRVAIEGSAMFYHAVNSRPHPAPATSSQWNSMATMSSYSSWTTAHNE